MPPAPFPPWPIWGALAVLAAFVITQIVTALGVGLVVRWGDFQTLLGPEAHSTLLAVSVPFSLVLSHLVGWGGILVLFRRHQMGFLTGLRLGPHALGSIPRAVLSGAGMQILVAILAIMVPPPPDFVSPLESFLRRGSGWLAALFVMAVLMAPPLEEALFRGVLLPALRRRRGFLFSALVVTALFTSMHATQTGTYWPPLVGIFLCGWALAWLRERSGSLWPSIAFHVGFNLTAFFPVLFLEHLV